MGKWIQRKIGGEGRNRVLLDHSFASYSLVFEQAIEPITQSELEVNTFTEHALDSCIVVHADKTSWLCTLQAM